MSSSNATSSSATPSQNAIRKAPKSGFSSGSAHQNRPIAVVSNVSRFTTFVYAPTPAATAAVPRSNSQMTSSSQSSNGCVSPPTVSSPTFSSTSSSLRKKYENGAAGGAVPMGPRQRHNSTQHQQQHCSDAAETECLEHYESNLEKYKDERDTIQKKTFTKWVNQHLIKNDRKVDDLFVDLRDGFNLITLLEILTDQHLHRENGTTRFHRIQNVQSCLETLRRRNVKLVNIRPEDIVEGNGKLTLGLIWTIILSFQVSMINHREIGLNKQAILANQSRPHPTSSVSDIDRTTNNGTSQATSSAATVTAPVSHLALLSAREALLQWARHVTSGYPGVNVANFSGSWKDGLAFCALLHFYRPGLINWEKINAQKPLDRLRNAFDTFESEFGVAKLLDPEDVCEVDTPDERSLITYISQLHNRLVDEPKGNLDDLVSRLTRGIGITNEKLDHLLTRIDTVDAAAERGERIELLERQVREIGDDLHLLKAPIDELFLDVDTLRQHRHADAADFNKQVIGLEQRRTAYLGRLEDELMRRLGITGGRYITEQYSTTSSRTRGNAFRRVEDAIQWIRDRTHKLNSMQFSETLEVLEQMFEQHKLDNRDIQDFRQTVDECIARQAEVSAEDSYDYCELLKMMESEYQQLRELSAGRMIDLDSLIAFIRAAQLELLWIHQREELEVTRNWSDLERLDIPMLQNYFKQLLHEIELHEKQFNDVHNQGAALINQRHPAGEVIEVYLRSMQNNWDWLLNLSKCLEGHLRDAYNAKAFVEESEQVEQQMQQQLDHLDREYARTDFSLDEGEQMLRQLDSVREYIQQLHARLLSLTDRCAQISPLWQRGERISKAMPVMALCEYKSKDKIHIRQGDECILLDNHDQIHWRVRGMDGVEASVPSVVFRIPPPDPRLASFLSRLHNQFEKLRKLWDRTHHLVRYNMVLNTMRTVRAWDLDTFLSIPSDQRDEIIKALNEDVNKLLSEMDPNDPLAKRLKDELRMTNEHFYELLARAQKGPEPDFSNQFDAACAELVRKFEEGWKQLNHRVQERVATNLEELERQIKEHKAFEDALQTLDVDVSNVKELYRQLPNPTPTQRAAHDNMVQRWQDIWELSRMYVERLKALESVLNGLDEVTDIVRRHEVTLASFDDIPAALERLRGVHAQLLELNMVLQQQENIVKKLNRDTATLRQHVARTRFGAANHPDVDQIEDRVSQITVRWDNVNSQVAERLRIAEEAQQTQMVYRSQYTEELGWLDRVEATINSLRRPEELRPEELQGQLDQLVAEYAQLQEHTATIENINKEGGKFIRDAKGYDLRLSQYHDSVISIHGSSVKQELRRQVPQPKTGATVVTEELELLNRRFAELSSVILERKNIVNVLIQNWRRKQQEAVHVQSVRHNAQLHALLTELARLQRDQQEQLKHQQLANAEDSRAVRDKFMEMREQLHARARQVEESIAEADKLCSEGAQTLSPDQFHVLKESRQQLQSTFESLLRQTDAALSRLDGVTALLLEFASRTSVFQSWVFERGRELDALRAASGDPARLDDSRKQFKELTEHIFSKRTELNAIAQLAQRIESEISAYLAELSRRNESPAPGLQRHQCVETAQRAQDDYEALLSAKQELAQLLRRVAHCSMQYEQKVEEVDGWMAELERAISHANVGTMGATADRLDLLSRLNQKAVEGQPRIEAVEAAAKQLDEATAQTDAHQRLQAEHADHLAQVRRRFRTLSDRLRDSVDGARAEITRREGLARGLQQMDEWLNAQERKLARPRTIPLSAGKLSELKYEDQLERGELENRAKTLAELGELLGTERHGANEQLGRHFGTVTDLFWRVEAMARAQSDNLREAVEAFEHWQRADEALAERMASLSDAVAQLSASDVDGADRLSAELDTVDRREWAQLDQLAKQMIQMPNVEQTEQLMRKMRSNESQLARIRRDLAAKQQSGEKTSELRRKFQENAQKIETELAEIESRIHTNLSGVSSPTPQQKPSASSNLISFDQQRRECNLLGQRLINVGRELKELEELGSMLIQTGGIGAAAKRRSTEMDETSGGGAALIGMTRQLFELHRKKDELDRSLMEIESRIERRNDERQKWETDRDSLNAWLEQERARLTNAWRALAWEPSSLIAQLAEVQDGQQRLRQNQHRLTQLKLNMEQLISISPTSDDQHQMEAAMDKLERQWHAVESGWSGMDKCISIAGGLAKEADRLEKWVDAKSRLADQCVVSAADVKLMDAQLAIAKMLLAEFVDERPHWERFNDDAAEAVRLADSEQFCAQIVCRVDELNRRWRQLEQRLATRVNALGESRRAADEFDALQRDLQRKVRSVEQSLNEATALRCQEDADQRHKLEHEQSQLVAQLGPALGQLREKGTHLGQSPVATATLRSDVEERVDTVAKMVHELDTKLASIRKAAENESAAEGELLAELSTLISWARQQKSDLDAEAPIAAEAGRLNAQIDQFRPKYESILAREGQVIVLGSKVTSLLAKTPSTALKDRLFALNEVWPALHSAAKKRQEKLDRVKRAVDELVEAEQSVKSELNKLREETNLTTPDALLSMPVLESLQQRLHALGPGVDSVFTVMDKLERALGGDSGAETKKHRLALEQLRRDYSALVSECNSALEQARNKEALKARFDSDVESVRSLLEDTGQRLCCNDLIGKDALKSAISDFDARWTTESGQLNSALGRLRPLMDSAEAAKLEAINDELAVSAKQLRVKAAQRMAEIEQDEGRVGNLLERTTNLANDVSMVGEEIASLTSIAREQNVLEEQLAECDQMSGQIEQMMANVANLDNEWQQIVDNGATSGGIGSAQAKTAKSDLQKMEKQLEKHRDELAQRRRRISEFARRMDELDSDVATLLADIQRVSAHDVLSQPLGADVNALKAQQEVLKMLKNDEMAELADRKERTERECKELLKGVGPGVNTDKLENHLRSLNSAWQQLASCDVERKERELEAAVQALGSFREAQQSLINWLDQTEQLIADQSPPSTDYKVVKAQLQNQEFQFKLVEDKRPNIEGFMDLAQKLEQMSGEEANRAQLKSAREQIASRYSDLLDTVNSRHQQLEDALILSQEWAKQKRQLANFLDESERQLHAFEHIPTDAQKMEEQTQLLDKLQQEADQQRAEFDRLVELATELGQMVSLEDGQELDTEMHQLVTRYDTLGTRLGQIGQLMGTLAEDIAQFLQSTEQLLNWLKEAEDEMHKFDDPSTDPEELGRQSDELATLVASIADQGQLVTQVVEISQELCAHTSGAEALTLQFRTDNLRQRYSRLADEAAGRINVLEKALPLAEDLKEGMAELVEHLDGVEEDLRNLGQVTLEEQFQLVNTIDADLGPAREQLDALHGVCVELQRLVTEQRAAQVARDFADLHRRFTSVADSVTRKADQLRQAERQSRHTFDVLDFWVDWFNDVQEQIVQADKPAVDLEQLRQQLRQQHALNQEIVAEKNGLRDMVVEATKVARELSSTLGGQEGQEAMMAKVERAKRLADETMELGTERVAELEQAFALCKELDAEYTELNEWMDGMEKELQACEPITLGIAAKALLAQQQHNNSMLQQIQSQRPMVAKFERNVAALSELCSEADEQNLKQIAENVAERFDDLATAFRERGDALASSIEQCSQLTDRLNIFLTNLSNALDQLRAQEAASCRPPVLRRQIDENGAIFDLLRQKEDHFRAMKTQAQDVLTRAGPNQQQMVADMAQRLEEMDQRWLELHSGAEYRRSHLEALLPITEHFWAQLDRVQQRIGTVRQRADTFGGARPGAVPAGDEHGPAVAVDDHQQPQQDEEDHLEEQLQQRQLELEALQNAIEECAIDVQQVTTDGLELCSRLDAEEERSFVQQHLAMLQAQWDTLLVQYTQISGNLSNIMDQTLQFYTLLQQLTAFLADKEAQANAIMLGTDSSVQLQQMSVEAIRDQLRMLEDLRRELDEWALSREQLNQMGAELCAMPGTQSQAPAIRVALDDLKQRWARLYAQLRDAQQHLERSLLDMGQLAHANDQMMAWLTKTEQLLATLDTTSDGGLKHVEIEQCKLRMIQNDIAAHQPSFEAIQATGQKMIQQDPQCAVTTQSMLDQLAKRWASVGHQAEQAWVELERARAEANSRSDDLNKWTVWLNDLLAELRTNRPIGGLPETAMAQLDEFRVVQADVEQRRAGLEECLSRLEEQLAATAATPAADGTAGDGASAATAAGGGADQWLAGQQRKLRADWTTAQQKLVEREARLRKALEDALELANGMQAVQDWLHGAEEHLAMVPQLSKLVEPLSTQLQHHQAFHAELGAHVEQMKELSNKGIRIQLSCEKKDAIPMKNRLVSLKHRMDKLGQRSGERLKSLTLALDESRLFFESRRDLLIWTEEQQRWLREREAAEPSGTGTGERIREALAEHRTLADALQRKASVYDEVRRRGCALAEHAPASEKLQLDEANEELTRCWEALSRAALRRQRSLEEALIQSGKFDEVLAELLDWLGTVLLPLEAELNAGNFLGDVDTLHTLVKEHHELIEQANTRRENVEKVRERALKILDANVGDAQELADLEKKLTLLNDQWDRLNDGTTEREKRLTSSLKKAVDLSELMHDLGSALQDIEARLRRPTLSWDEKSVLAEQAQLDQLRDEFVAKLPEFERIMELAKELLRNAHPRAEAPLRELVRGMSTRWELLDQLINDRSEKLRNRLDEIRHHEQMLDELLGFVDEKQGQLELMRECSDEGQLSRLSTLMDEQQMFKADLHQRQAELDDLLRVANKRLSLVREASESDPAIDAGDGPSGGAKAPLAGSSTSGGSRRDSHQLLQQQQQPLSPTKRAGSRLKLHDSRSSMDGTAPLRTSLGTAIEKKRTRRKSDTLHDNWKRLWTDLLQYEQKLHERKAHLQELERLKGFTFDDWRERYLAWNDHGKARVSDLFRRIDKSGTGMVPRKLFIDGILASKFPTTALEMARVADEFDKGDGLIASREFMNALRFDPKKMRRHEPKTETERIHEEIARETARCTCAHRFPIQHISSDKDRVQYGFGFGGSMKRMVRILRSTVMVRVGGGWEALDGFLAKHDPCRAKGRINVDLLPLVPDDHLRPSGAVDRMEMFTRRKDSSGSPSTTTSSAREVEKLLGFSPGQPGPIMKIREKTERSMAMFKRPSPVAASRSDQSQQQRGYDPAIIDDMYGSSRIPRPAELASNHSSRPASRASDMGSDIGTNGTAGVTPSRIPAPRPQQQKGVRFASGTAGSSDGSGRNTPSAL